MNQDLLERTVTSSMTRRTVVKTGAKLAYAVPLVAASFKLSGMSAHAQDLCDGCDDDLSTKPLEGGCYTCKVIESGCETTRGSAQVDDLDPANIGGLVCVCQSATCVVGGVTYTQDQVIGGACHPVNVAGTDYCGGVDVVSPA